jgi:uncharacterized membrane protein
MNHDEAMELARFMASPAGRGLRIAVGAAMVLGGISRGGTGGALLAMAGLLPLLAGATNKCLLAPVLGVPFDGKRV